MLKAFIAISILCAATSASADCWTVGNFKGFSAPQYDNYTYGSDGISSQTFNVLISNKKASIVPGDLDYVAASTNSVVGRSVDNRKLTLETWAIDTETKKAFFTQTRIGSGSFDGTKSFIGDVLGHCKE